jgi:hypothetical protein
LSSVASALCPATLTEVGNFAVWTNPDDLFEATTNYAPGRFLKGPRTPAAGKPVLMPRVFMLREIFNTMAAWVNGLRFANPLTFAHSHLAIAPNNGTLGGDTFSEICPIDQYAQVNGPHAFLTTKKVNMAELFPRTPFRYCEVSYGVGAKTADVSEVRTYGFTLGTVLGIHLDQGTAQFSHYYLTIATVKAYAEANGFKFVFENLSRPLGLSLEETEPGEIELAFPAQNPATYSMTLPTLAVWGPDKGAQNWRSQELTGILKNGVRPGTQLYFSSSGGYDRFKLTGSESILNNWVGYTVSPNVWAPKTAMAQQYLSTGISSQTVAILTPEQTFKHTTNDYGGQSFENFQRFVGGGAGYLPIGVEGEAGIATVRAIGGGDVRIEAAHPEDELVVIFRNVVELT